MENAISQKRSAKSIIVIFLGLIGLGALIFWKMNQVKPGSGPQGMSPGAKPPPQKVTGYISRAENIPMNIKSSATLLAWNEVQLMAEAAGKILEINISEGSKVTKGQVLVSLFDEDLKAQAKKQELQTGIAKKNIERLKDLVKINAASQQELDNAENLANNITSDLNLIQANLKKTKILAPFSGTIGLTNASVGSYVNSGNAVASLQQMDVLKLEFSIPEKYGHLLTLGDKVAFTTESQPDTFLAVVYAFEPKIDPSTRTLKVRAKFDNRFSNLLPGSFAKASLKLREIKNAILIPTQCIIPETRGKKVIVAKNGIGQFVSVETGIRDQNRVQILSGISIGDTVLTSGLMFVKPGADIIITDIK